MMMRDEGPSQEDIERFSSHETGYCPKCGAEIWDDAEQCPACGIWMQGGTSHREPIANEFRKRSILAVVIIILFACIYGLRRIF